MLVGELITRLSRYPEDREVCSTSRIQYGTSITAINYVGEDKHGNLVITFDDSLLKEAKNVRT